MSPDTTPYYLVILVTADMDEITGYTGDAPCTLDCHGYISVRPGPHVDVTCTVDMVVPLINVAPSDCGSPMNPGFCRDIILSVIIFINHFLKYELSGTAASHPAAV